MHFTGKLKGKVLVCAICTLFVLAGALLLPPMLRTARAAASGDYEYTVNDDGTTATITGYTGTGGDITIPNTVTDGTNTYTVTRIGDEAFFSKHTLINVSIPAGVITIGDQAFFQCYNMKNISISSGVTEIGDNTFEGCYKLKNITVEPTNTAYCSVDGVLYSYDKTVLVKYPKAKPNTSYTLPSSVGLIDKDALSFCENLGEVMVADGSSFFTSQDGVLFSKDMSRLVLYPIAKSDTHYTIPTGVIHIGNRAFYWVRYLKDITIPYSVESIGNESFSSCNRLSRLSLPNSVTSIGKNAFSSCSALGGINIPDGVTTIEDQTFSACRGLTSIEIPDSITSIGNNAFSQCDELTTILIPNSVTNISDSAFTGCKNLKAAYFYGNAPVMGSFVFDYCSSDFTVYYARGKTGYTDPWNGYKVASPANIPPLIEAGYPGNSGEYEYWVTDSKAIVTGYNGSGGNVVIPSQLGGYPVVRIGPSVFSFNESVTAVSIPDGVKSIGMQAFFFCINLNSVSFANSVNRIEFEAFGSCRSLRTVVLPTSLINIDHAVFEGCERLKYVTIPEGVTYMGGGVFSQTAIENITIPASVSKIGQSIFGDCRLLSRAYFLGNAPSLSENSSGDGGLEGIFKGCADGFKIYYARGTTGFTNPWHGYATEEFDPAAPPTYTISTVANPNDHGTAKGGGTFNYGSTVSLVATPMDGYRFSCWSDSYEIVSTDAVYTFTVLDDSTIMANFEQIGYVRPITAVSAGPSSINLSWNAVEGAAGYEIWRSCAKALISYTKIASVTGTTYADTGLTTNVMYSYNIRAYCTTSTATTYGDFADTASASPVSSVPAISVDHSAETAPALPASSPPAISASSPSYNKANIFWSGVSGANGYQLYRATSPDGAYKLLKTTKATSYTNTGLGTGITYYYKVRAYRTVGRTKVYGDYSALASVCPAISSVARATASAYNPTSVKVSWSSVPGRTKYEVWRSTSPDDGFAFVKAVTGTSYKDTTLTPFVTYYYQIRVYRTSGRYKAYGASASPTASARPVLNDVAGVRAAAKSPGGVKLSWAAVMGASGYEVWRSTSPDGGYEQLKAISGRSYTDINLIPNQTYYYQVRAYRKAGGGITPSAFSAPVSATPYFGSVAGPKAMRSSAMQIKLTWKAVTGRSGYEVYRSTAYDGEYELIKSITGSSFTDSGLTTGVTYYYKICAYRTVNGVKYRSADSAIVSATQ